MIDYAFSNVPYTSFSQTLSEFVHKFIRMVEYDASFYNVLIHTYHKYSTRSSSCGFARGRIIRQLLRSLKTEILENLINFECPTFRVIRYAIKRNNTSVLT